MLSSNMNSLDNLLTTFYILLNIFSVELRYLTTKLNYYLQTTCQSYTMSQSEQYWQGTQNYMSSRCFYDKKSGHTDKHTIIGRFIYEIYVLVAYFHLDKSLTYLKHNFHRLIVVSKLPSFTG